MALHLSILLLTVFISVDKTCGCSPDLPNLRNFSVYGYGGFFNMTKQDFQREISKRLASSTWPSVNLHPRDSDPEFSIYLSNVKDTTLKESGYVPNDYNEIAILLPVKVGTGGNATDGDLQLGHFTETDDTLNPYLVNYARTVVIKQLTITEEANSVTWSIKDGINELEIIVERSDGQQDLKSALRKRDADEGYNLKTDFPNTLDWGCDKIPVHFKPHFCSVLSDRSSEIAAAGEHISNINTVLPDDSDDGDVGATYVMKITKITGYFQTILSFAQVNQESLFAFRGISHESVGIAYDCINEE